MSLGFNPIRFGGFGGDHIERVVVQNPLHFVFAYTQRSIHDVINNPIARNEVRFYFKVHQWVKRESQISDLNRQWITV